MEKVDIFKDIAERTGGDIYLGVVGAVRTGKSTFIKRFMELVVIPNIQNEADKARAQDELPQSAAGKTIMTTEPKFVPNQAVTVKVDEGLEVNIRLVDCVGYAVPGAKGYEDENGPRMIHTPWYEEPIPFHEAAEIGTRKVIQEHSTIGVVITTDGTISEIPRQDYIEAEERVIHELKEVGKPFIMIVNTVRPHHPDTEALRRELAEKYDIPVLAMSVESMREADVYNVLREALYEFPVLEVNVNLPSWVMVLREDHWLRESYQDAVRDTVKDIKRLRDVDRVVQQFSEYDFIEKASLAGIEMGRGIAEIDLYAPDELYDQILKEVVGVEIRGKDHLLQLMQDFAHAKSEYDQIADALKMVKQTGYGIAAPALSDMSLDEPEIIRQGSRFGVRLKAVAPSIHMIKVDVESEFAPIIGTEKQSEELVRYLMQDFEDDPLSIWNSDIFGRSLSSIVREGIQAKLALMPENARYKLKETLERIINEGSGGLIAIIL
ncbi:stage IV sporulation protein A [Parageobacillus thermoglucosidasius]|uniref:Stage IV sporulation protein A n=1 Tax=Parageobacillus thermoglucosidasius TaxID=1426 RepID=A0AAN0YR16_PARTM|nr:stage IV sporulation protein A [Parageobacillus thermoglucosidasius]AEH47437.1 stage IV sporulation protein A [Parageobacillus thermoglucosidasius C56-YS93]ALF11322.1 stage IV sporulation protein A [Parageobacillus thermoglucosidasius]ANZ31399.1 stage IV sporulation protein A [Parageobacillus thermoglucosidasius]APM82137.1 stage IV sporulation protein A [Parageobacillus thermoglucosidasius]KJX68027.1 stage IV sporulation protein A [Parageobacillus thermoglucosidasius]